VSAADIEKPVIWQAGQQADAVQDVVLTWPVASLLTS
jgi:hypothetical protein